MTTRTQRMSGNSEKCNFTPDTSGGRLMQQTGDFPPLFQSDLRPSAETIADRDSMRSMEERYGIGEEGLF
jgi:hypothetical protein